MKKTWIKIKRGLLELKHRDKLGIRIWLYVYILDHADWDTGQILEWRDGDAADDLQMPKRTLQQQRQQLMEDGYITCKQKGNKQIITIHNWTNPRKYDGEVTNPKGEGTRNHVPLEVGGTNEGTREGTNEGLSKPRTPSYRSHITDQRFNISWQDFKEHRKQIKKPMTELAENRMLKKLGKYSVSVAIEMLDRSIENGWQGVFELDGKEQAQSLDSELERAGYVRR